MADTQNRPDRGIYSGRWALAGLLGITLLVRSGVLWTMRGNLEQDPDAYREIAENLLIHGEFSLGKPTGEEAVRRPTPTAYRPPLYPVVLSNLPAVDGHHISLLKVAILHVLLGLATVGLTWLTARRWCPEGLGPALLAGLLVACDPILLNQQTLVMTETLAAFLAILSLWCLARFDAARTWFNAALAGGAIGLAVLCRPTFLPWLVFVAFSFLLIRSQRSLSHPAIRNSQSALGIGWSIANVCALVLVAAVVLSPWAIRNYRVLGKPIATTTHGGYTLLLGNNSSFYDWLEKDKSGLPWTTPAVSQRYAHVLGNVSLLLSMNSASMVMVPQSEVEIDAMSYDVAIQSINSRPISFLKACIYRVGQLWSPLPHKLSADESNARRMMRYATCVWYLGVYVLTAMGVWRLRWKLLHPPWIWGVLLCVAFSAVHTFYWTNLRMRAPLMPFVAIMAAAAIRPKAESSI